MNICEQKSKRALGAIIVFLIAMIILVQPLSSAIASDDPIGHAGGDFQRTSWCGDTLAVQNSFTGQTRWYDGNNVGIEFTATSSSYGTLEVSLFRSTSWITNEYIGTGYHHYPGWNKTTWSNVGSGNYYFKFTNTGSNAWVYSNDVAMYSW